MFEHGNPVALRTVASTFTVSSAGTYTYYLVGAMTQGQSAGELYTPREVAIVMAVTDPDAPPHARASMILVPTDTPGFGLVRNVSVMGHSGGGHAIADPESHRVHPAFLSDLKDFVVASMADRIELLPHPADDS